tara:strand:- start:13693 stop:14874 length:1182 start_codon:yes stop_codon:yes gene_type:complete
MMPLHKIEGLLNLVSAVGIIFYLAYVWRNKYRTLFEARISLLLFLFFWMFTVRGVGYWNESVESLSKFILLPAAFLPLSGIYFVEGMLRRHAPKWIKIFVSLGTVAVITQLMISENDYLYYGMIFFQISTLLLLISLLMSSKNQDGSSEERLLQQRIFVAFTFGLPFYLTDYAQLLNYPIARVGCIGGLILVLSALLYFETHPRRKLIMTFLTIFIQDALATLMIVVVLSEMNATNFVLSFELILVCHLVFIIFNSSFFAERSHLRGWAFRVINSGASGKGGVHVINKALQGEGITFHDESMLNSYDLNSLKSFLAKSAKVRYPLNELNDDNSSAAEQLAYLLEESQANTLLVLIKNPLVVVTMNNPTNTSDANTNSEQAVVSQFVQATLGAK